MRAVVITEAGGPEVLGLREWARPGVGPGQVRVRVRASGINRADLLQRRGHYPAPAGWPQEIPGLEYAGTVDEVGQGVEAWRVGDEVMGLVGSGGCAEYVVVHERTPVRVPEGVPLPSAGAIPEVFMTAWDALFRQMELQAGETLLIHAVGSGVGTAALQLARTAGVRTVGTSRTPEKVERAAKLGLDVGVVSDEAGWLEPVRSATRKRGVDVILDLVGAAYLADNVRALAEGGRWIVVGVPSGVRGEIDLRALMGRRARVRGTVLRARPLEEKAILAREFEERVVPLFERGALEPVIHGFFPPEEAGRAHAVMEGNENFGKLILEWED
ncbi:MAG: zinc-binding dehydrogenase [Gemmatimonadetes bacterium]|nr:NAD(P)H-quinone oxidoreductase [Gemmatimonadota bacterium]NIR80237.1 NAD(P)H-quinone oxidoreductase [Gemmatimonadota bacterium]NIT88991.1 NAD(P)H-quinone oxidoreductase [Gemmatimonadota bacterium]NIU32787.1 NAD(P)H-quinone oxidoreductase [Gemmatimonadota bacterium]NIU37218.1 zinc-binding dehydrogenase [Gemmatimonadota bacterium]